MDRFIPGILLILATSFSVAEARSFQSTRDEPPVHKATKRKLKIPFIIPPADRSRYEWIELWSSRDEGKTWEAVARAKATDQYLKFQTDDDGMFWFTVRTVNTDGWRNPERLEDLRPSYRVLIESPVPKTIDPGAASLIYLAPRFFDQDPTMVVADVTLGYRLAVSLVRSRLSACGCAGLR